MYKHQRFTEKFRGPDDLDDPDLCDHLLRDAMIPGVTELYCIDDAWSLTLRVGEKYIFHKVVSSSEVFSSDMYISIVGSTNRYSINRFFIPDLIDIDTILRLIND